MGVTNGLLGGLLGVAAATGVAAQVPSTDIFLAEVQGDSLGQIRRLTDREGYDNQPQFLPDGETLAYSSFRDGGTDIYILDLDSGKSRLLLATPESEYSPTPIPGKPALSVVRDYGDLKQQLWSFPLNGSAPSLLLPDVNPVGYHAWVDDARLILFVLGEPPTLQLAAAGAGPGTVLADSPGRGLARIPGDRRMSFVDKSAEEWWVTAIDADSGETERLFATPAGREDYAWTPDGALWMADDSRIYRRAAGGKEWQPVADLDADGVYGITRLVFSPDGSRLALVSARPPADLAAAYRDTAGKILGAALTDLEGWEKLEYLTTRIGHRLSGSNGLERAIDWAVERMQEEGLQVRKQPVMVPHWVRGRESARVVAPVERDLAMLGLGNSVGTGPAGIRAPVLVVRSFEELEQRGREQVAGKIVVYAVDWEGYGETVRFRGHGASRAAALGAVAVLVRSATGRSLYTPHTGALRYDDDRPRIPAAAIAPEDTHWMYRMQQSGQELEAYLQMDAEMLVDAESFNIIAEIPGGERPEEVVVMGGHYDSWDVGEGAHDDGASCMAAWQALRILQKLELRPRRTLRVVLWTNEENGLRGAREYHAALDPEQVADHVAALEMDGGCERPVGFGFGLLDEASSGQKEEEAGEGPVYEAALAKLEQIGSLLEVIDAHTVFRGGGGADIGPLMRAGVPGLGLRTVGEHYFDWHHTRADTLDKIDMQDFRKAIALLSVMGFVLADMPERLVP